MMPRRLHGYGDMVSLVVLSTTFVELTLESLCASLDQIYPSHFLPPREQGSFVADSENLPGGEYFIKSDVPGARGMFLLYTVPGPYTAVSDFADHIADSALRRLAEEQACWLSVDLVHDSTNEDEAYRFIGSVLAHLAPADTAALVHPSKLTTIAFDGDLRRRLASGGQIFGTA
jgi:hypothetical protein